MLDIKFIRQNPDKVKEGIAKKRAEINIELILELDNKKREILQKIESLRSNQKKLGKENIVKAQKLKAEIKNIEPELINTEKKLDFLMRQIPNLPLEEVPSGKDEKENVILREWGKKTNFDFKPKDYLQLAESMGLIDIKRAAKVSGTRFGYVKGKLAVVQFALISLTIEFLTKKGFLLVLPPVMIKDEMMEAMGYVDTEADRAERYFLEKDKLYLVGTSEQSIGPMHTGEILEEMPKRYLAYSACFRREAGAYGKDTKGILRVHQFDKMEMFSFCKPENSTKENEFILEMGEKLMQSLCIPYRVVQLCTGELSGPSANTYDIEAWMPGQNCYRETHSASNCTDFQARRLNIRYRTKNGLQFCHTLNGTAFAMGRILIAIIENYQKKDGSILVPEALQKYAGFKKI